MAIAPAGIMAQETAPELEVVQVVKQLSEGMRQGDSAMVSAAFLKDAQLYTASTNKEGQAELEKGSLQAFLNAVGTPHDKVWDEPVWDMEIKIEENLAQVWTKYAFYIGNSFSHCGVDAFHLFKTDEGWKIFHLTDTRKQRNCEVPEAVQKRRQK